MQMLAASINSFYLRPLSHWTFIPCHGDPSEFVCARDMSPGPSLQNTVGALLAGAMFSAALSGVLAVQIFFYLRRYPRDHRLYKFMVAWFWIIDTMQTSSIAAAMWTYLIRHYGDPDTALKIYPSVSVAISCTPLIAACVNILQAVRIYELNHHSLGTLVPHVILSVIRFGEDRCDSVKLLRTFFV
ncbi:hypothetical protein BC827DRAFT_1236042 [Russula dissimulans]|nr:hypothetical protein BC827DRAFT_1236042 [Russula dissimulans]